ncbi:MAG: MCE family protein [Gordonia sp. (in: high G+C Gram-positive bacteria)]|uniref:MCE family protein n=1 Tax=Gordonia sp. (in: high G+C Gram-positive bacteria) TaxID=84139 RepID=UPI0039E4FAF4
MLKYSRTGTPRRWSRAMVAVSFTALGAVGLTGCSLVPMSVKSATGQMHEITAYFDRAAGLYPGNDVAVLGMPVGRVKSLQPEGTKVKVKMLVDRGIDIPKDVTAAIVNTSIVTTRHIELTPAYTGGDKLPSNGTVPHTASPVEIGTLFDSIDSLVDNLKGNQKGSGPLADLVDITSGVADGNGQRLRDALVSLDKAGKLGADNGDQIASLIKSMATLTTALTDNYPKMKSFSSSVTQVADMLGEQSPGLQATLANVNQTLANTAEFLENNSGNIASSTGRLASLANNLSDFSRQVVDSVDMGPLLFQNLSNSISAEQGAWRAQVLLDKSLVDNEMLATFCEAINLRKNGCRTGKLSDFGPDLGVFSGLLELSQK